MVAANQSNDAYELDLKNVLDLIRSYWLFILLFTIVVVFLFASVLVLLGSEQESYSETIQYFSDSLLASVDIKLLPRLFTEERVLYHVYERDSNPEKGSFDDYVNQFSASVIHDDAVALTVTGIELEDTRRLIDSWQETIDQDVLAGLRSSRTEVLNVKIQEKLLDYQDAYLVYQSYYDEMGIEEKKLQLSQLQALINQYTYNLNTYRLLTDCIQQLREALVGLPGNEPLTPANLLLLENLLSRYASDNLIIDSGGQLYSEMVLGTPPANAAVLEMLDGIDGIVDLTLEFQEAEILNASAQIAILRQETEQDPRLIEVEELANYQKRQYLNAISELEDLSDEGYSVSYSWMEPTFTIWEQISIIHLAVIAVAAVLAAVFFLIIRDWWKQFS